MTKLAKWMFEKHAELDGGGDVEKVSRDILDMRYITCYERGEQVWIDACEEVRNG